MSVESDSRVRCGPRQVAGRLLPDDQESAPGLQDYFATSGRPGNRPSVEELSNGSQRPDCLELELGTAVAELRSA
jgi:hypothetical protein